jgi:hypothetical protein
VDDLVDQTEMVDDLTDGKTMDVFVRTAIGRNQTAPDALLYALVNLSVGGGSGYNWELIPGVFAPGFYFDMGVSVLTLLLNMGRDEDEDLRGLMLNSGLYVQNQFRWGGVDLAPFYGISATFGFFKESDDSSTSFAYMGQVMGLRVSIQSFGVEYALYSPLFKAHLFNVSSHRISVMYHVR